MNNSDHKYCQEPGCGKDIASSIHTAVDSKKYYWCSKHGFQAPEGADLPRPPLLEATKVNVSNPIITFYVEATCPYCEEESEYDELEEGEHELPCNHCDNRFKVNVQEW